MSTDVIVRNAPLLAKDLPQSHGRQEVNESPIAPQNLSFIKKLSKGKYSVYLTSSKINNQKYVMKVFSGTERNCEKHYNNEARFASLSHPNVISIVHSETNKTIVQDGQFMKASYILSEYAPHGDLFDFIINHKDEIDEKLTRTYFRQLIDGIEYLHTIGIAHLDLKPENLLIGADFSLKIADFDLSYVAGDEKILSRGTRRYRGPEFYNSTSSAFQLETPSASDIYGAAIVLFVLKCGGMYAHTENRPVDGINFTELLEKNSSKFWSKHCEIQGKSKGFFDKKFIKLFEKMVKTDPSERASIKKIKKSKWYNGPVYTASELQLKMKTILHC